MQIGLLVPQGWKGEYDGWDPAEAWSRSIELAEHAEGLGVESLWVFDHFHTVPDPTDEITFESFTMLSALAMVTERVKIGHMVVCTGFRPDYSLVDGIVIGDDGWPVQERGVLAGVGGAYVVGLAFQTRLASQLIGGVGRDAEQVVRTIVARSTRSVAATDQVRAATG